MKILDIALADFKMSLRNKVSFALVLVMPMLMISLMGYALKPVFQMTEKIEPFSVLYVNQDHGQFGRYFDIFINNQEALDIVDTSVTEMESLLQNREYSLAVIVPEDLTSQVLENNSLDIDLVSTGDDFINEEILKSTIDSFIETAAVQRKINAVYQSYFETDDSVVGAKAMQQSIANHGNNFITAKSNIKTLNDEITSFQFFSASMLIFFLLTSGMGVGGNIINERINKTYQRVISFPVSRSKYLLGKILSNAIISTIQALSIILFTIYVFDTSWGEKPFVLGIIIMLLIFISSAIGVLLSSIMNSSKAFISTLTVTLWFMTFISGGFTASPLFEPLDRFTINFWAFESITDIMTGGTVSQILPNLLIMTIIACCLWALSLIFVKRRASYE